MRPPLDQNFLNFMQFFRKFDKIVCWHPRRVGASSYGESGSAPEKDTLFSSPEIIFLVRLFVSFFFVLDVYLVDLFLFLYFPSFSAGFRHYRNVRR